MSHQGSKKLCFVATDADTYPSGEAAPNLLAGPSTGPPTALQTPSGSFTQLPSVSSLLNLAGVVLDDKPIDPPPPGAQSRTSLIRSLGRGGSSQSVTAAVIPSRASLSDLSSVRETSRSGTTGAATKQRARPKATPTTYSYEHLPRIAQTTDRPPPTHSIRATPLAPGEAPHLRLTSRPDPSSGSTLSTLQFGHSAHGEAPPPSSHAEPKPALFSTSQVTLFKDLQEIFASRNNLEVENTIQRGRISELESQLFSLQAELGEAKANYEAVRDLGVPSIDSVAKAIRAKCQEINQLRDANAYLTRQRNEALDFARSQPSGASFTFSAEKSKADNKRRKLGSGAGYSMGELGNTAGQPSGPREQGPREGEQAVRGWGV